MKNIIFIFVLSLIIPFTCFSQITNAGNEFVICFPKNDDFEFVGAVLNISLINDEPTIANVEVSTSLDGDITTYTIPAKESINIKLDSRYELSTINGIETNSVTIKSDTKISVIALSRTQSSAGTYLAIPTTNLDTNYIISLVGNRDHLTLAQLSIVGIYDSTKISINTKVKLTDSIKQIINSPNFYLNRGEVLVLSPLVADSSDFTGTIVSSNKSISVFASHQRTSFPIDYGYQDFIVDMVPPISILGTECIYTPTRFPLEKDLIISRFVAAFDSTRLQYRDLDTILDKSEYIEYRDTEPFFAKSDKPILFTQFEKSARLTYSKGDPFIVYSTPKEQWLNRYIFYSPELVEFVEHWVNVVIDSNGLASLTFDENPIDKSLFKQIPNSSYFWAQIPIKNGFHKIYSDSLFSILVYGYGSIVSYGYSGGRGTKRLIEKILDKNPPQAIIQAKCLTNIEITEKNEYDSGIDNIKIIESKNMNVNINPYSKGDKTATGTLALIDNTQDGYAIINTRDIKGFERMDTLFLYGFRVSIDYKSLNDTIYYTDTQCDTLHLENLGSVACSFYCYMENNTEASIPPSYFQIKLNPGQDTLIPICVRALSSAQNVLDRVILRDSCDRIIDYDVEYIVTSYISDLNSKCDVELEYIIVSDLRSLINKKTNNTNSTVQIYDLTGSLIYTGDNFNLPRNLSNSVYFVQLYQGNKLTNRFVISLE